MARVSLLCLLVLSIIVSVCGHVRMKCPKARDWNDKNGVHIPFDNTGNKVGPCGPYSGAANYGMGGIVKLTPNAWQTFVFEESIAHIGSPFRLVILDENEVETLVLLNHIPHNDAAAPIPYVESTYTPYNLTVFIPDINCKQCTLQMLMFMTDKTVKCGVETCTYYADDSACSGHTDNSPACFGAPNNNPCKHANTCFSNYHSCVDITIDGKVPLHQATYSQPEDWPYRNLVDLQYGTEAATWTNALLQGVSSNYTTTQGQNFC